MKIDFKKDSNLLGDAKINTRLVLETLIKKLKNKDGITQAELKQCYKEVKSFVLTIIRNFLRRYLYPPKLCAMLASLR